jgi:AcrR family transcriptional regulator
VPRITAPTVAEHRARQRAAILDAAEDVVADAGVPGLTFAAVAARSGLARSSLYEYFDSPGMLLAALVTDRMQRWGERARDRLATLADPEDRIAAYIDAALSPTTGRRRLSRAVTMTDLPAECSAALRELHHVMARPLAEAIGDMGVRDVERATGLVQGLIEAGMRAIDAGRPAAAESGAAAAFAIAGLRAAVSADREDASTPT